MPRRLLLLLLAVAAWLALGAAGAVAQGWADAARAAFRGGTAIGRGATIWPGASGSRRLDAPRWPMRPPPNWPPRPQQMYADPRARTMEGYSVIAERTQMITREYRVAGRLFGWPAPSMLIAELSEKETAGAARTWSLLAIDIKPGKPFRAGASLPLYPLWPGFAVNAAVYAAAAWTAVALLRIVRGLLRRARGRCPRCGYARAGLADPNATCPECGRVLRPRRMRAGAAAAPVEYG